MTACRRVLIALATYNEMENLPEVVAGVRRAMPQADLLFVDDNSPDGTGRWIAELAERDQRVAAIHRPHKLGVGSATLAALQHAVDRQYNFVVALDADGSHDPHHIPAMLEAMEVPGEPAPDIVIGSRYVAGGGTVGWPWYRRLMSRGVNAFARLMLGLPVSDCSGAFRCTRVELLQRIDLASCRSRGYALLEELLWRYKRADAVFCEIPIVFSNRKHGHSKINTRESISAVLMLTRLGLRNWLGLG